MTITKRIAVVGLYNSGSTALAGMLHRMGVNMGAPFWTNSEEDHPENFYESWDLSIQIRSWWTEPLIVETAAASERIKFLKNWASAQQFVRPCPLGAKHPMLSLSVNDLLEAWGANTCIIRAWRPLEESIRGLERRRWFPGHEVALQSRLWQALDEAEQRRRPAATLDWNAVKSDPVKAASDLAAAAGLNLTEAQIRFAAGFVRMPVLSSAA